MLQGLLLLPRFMELEDTAQGIARAVLSSDAPPPSPSPARRRRRRRRPEAGPASRHTTRDAPRSASTSAHTQLENCRPTSPPAAAMSTHSRPSSRAWRNRASPAPICGLARICGCCHWPGGRGRVVYSSVSRRGSASRPTTHPQPSSTTRQVGLCCHEQQAPERRCCPVLCRRIWGFLFHSILCRRSRSVHWAKQIFFSALLQQLRSQARDDRMNSGSRHIVFASLM